MKPILLKVAIAAFLTVPAPAGTLNTASIPSSADLSSITFEGIKRVELAARTTSPTDASYCRQLQFRDPGGSIYCPSSTVRARSAAFEVTYSFRAQPMASDEFGNRRFTFHVYFPPEALTGELREMLSAHKMNKTEAAGWFSLTTAGEPVRSLEIDAEASAFCSGNYVEGSWIHTDSKCVDKIEYKSVTEPSGYVTVTVEPALMATH